jgi:hypothetical protein
MSNYCYKGISLNNIIHGASSADNALLINEHYYTNDSSNNTISTTPSTVPMKGIAEIPNQVSYEINDDDITEYCIANFVEGIGSSIIDSTLPSWCNNIRVILVGGGAGGALSISQQQPVEEPAVQQQSHNSGYDTGLSATQKFYNDNCNYQVNVNTVGGNGGPGGGFIYISSLQTSGLTSLQAVCGLAGAAGNGGQNTSLILTINGKTYNVIAGGATTTSGGINIVDVLSVTANINGTTTTQSPGYSQVGDQYNQDLETHTVYGNYYGYTSIGGNSGNNTGTAYATKQGNTPYGNGGAGGSNNGGYPSAGAQGYYRIYYLT